MGPGVPPPPKPPTTLFSCVIQTVNRRPATVLVVVCSGSHSGCESYAFVPRSCGGACLVVGEVLGLLVPVNSTPHDASISGLSTPSSTGGLTPTKVGWETSSWNELPA